MSDQIHHLHNNRLHNKQNFTKLDCIVFGQSFCKAAYVYSTFKNFGFIVQEKNIYTVYTFRMKKYDTEKKALFWYRSMSSDTQPKTQGTRFQTFNFDYDFSLCLKYSFCKDQKS